MKKLSITEMNRLTAEDYKKVSKIPLTLVLDNVRSLHNIGSVFRTSDAFLVEKIILCGISSCPPQPEIHKTALGAEFTVGWAYEEDCLQALNALRQQGYILFAAEQATDSISLEDLRLDSGQKYALVLGNEVKGVQQEALDLCHHCVEIPQYGTKHSLNVSVASGILVWSFFEQLRKYQ
ncbi:MAG: RNA methyltransferase [Bacteroidales bacterium]|nr:RNA methyltransferase [Bacteroidales bacterium]